MVRHSGRVTVWLALGLLVLALGLPVPALAQKEDQAAAVRAVEQLGGRVEVDEQRPGKPVVAVHLTGTQVTDAGLVHLKGLKSLQELNLSNTQVTDRGLVHLKGLKSLQDLNLWNTRVTDRGVEELRLARPGLQIFR